MRALEFVRLNTQFQPRKTHQFPIVLLKPVGIRRIRRQIGVPSRLDEWFPGLFADPEFVPLDAKCIPAPTGFTRAETRELHPSLVGVMPILKKC